MFVCLPCVPIVDDVQVDMSKMGMHAVAYHIRHGQRVATNHVDICSLYRAIEGIFFSAYLPISQTVVSSPFMRCMHANSHSIP